MKKLILLLITSAIASQVMAGEIGNETVGRNGQPTSTAVEACEERMSFEDFQKKMSERKQYTEYFEMLKQIYAPFELRMHQVAENSLVCVTKETIEELLPGLPASTQPRMAIWWENGANAKHLILIAKKYFYANEVNDGQRANTIVRELIHPIFDAAFKNQPDLRTGFMKLDLSSNLYQTFVSQKPENNYSKIFSMINDYGLINGLDSIEKVCSSNSTEYCLLTIAAQQREKIIKRSISALLRILNYTTSEDETIIINLETVSAILALLNVNEHLTTKDINNIDFWIKGYVARINSQPMLNEFLNLLRKFNLLSQQRLETLSRLLAYYALYRYEITREIYLAEILMKTSLDLTGQRANVVLQRSTGISSTKNYIDQIEFLKKYGYEIEEIFKGNNDGFLLGLLEDNSIEELSAFFKSYPGMATQLKRSIAVCLKTYEDTYKHLNSPTYKNYKEKIKLVRKSE
jgi:hypothetical protein